MKRVFLTLQSKPFPASSARRHRSATYLPAGDHCLPELTLAVTFYVFLMKLQPDFAAILTLALTACSDDYLEVPGADNDASPQTSIQ